MEAFRYDRHGGASEPPPSCMSSYERPLRVRALSCHAWYRCAHSGQCCRAGWPIPVEPHRLPGLQRAIADPRVAPAPHLQPLHWVDHGQTALPLLGRHPDGACVFHEADSREGGCRIHRVAGPDVLPVACRQFPRVARRDDRGVDVSLSHWCPTALGALAGDIPMSIVQGPAAFRDADQLEGLDARGAWPPLLRPDCLFDAEAFDLFETLTVAALSAGRTHPWQRLAGLAGWWERVRAWQPHDGSLAEHIRATAHLVDKGQAVPDGTRAILRGALWRDLRAAIPSDWQAQADQRTAAPGPEAAAVLDAPEGARLVARYLTARFFGSWLAYQGEGVRSSLAGLSMALVALEHGVAGSAMRAPYDRLLDGIRTADLLLLHLAVPEALAAAAARHEAQRPALAALDPT
jgi:hypothetical protein